MKRNRIQPAAEAGPRTERSVHLSDYLAILRDHKWVALVPFLLIIGGSLALTLLATPVYKAEALVEIDSEGNGAGLLGDLQMLEGKAKVEAEMEIMRSRKIARDAAARLVGEGRSADFLVEVNAYRPLEVLIAAVRGSPPRCDVEVEAPALPEGKSPETYLFRFVPAAEEGRLGVEIEKIRKSRFGSDREMQRIDVTSGESFRVFDRRFRLTVDGDPVGREYQITLRNREDLANWLRAHTTVAELGRNTGIVALGFKAETPRMAQADAMYRRLGFVRTPPYYDNPVMDVVFYALSLDTAAQESGGSAGRADVLERWAARCSRRRRSAPYGCGLAL